MKKQSVFQGFLVVVNIICLIKANDSFTLRERLNKEFENDTILPDALDSRHSLNQPKQRRRETSVTWLRSRLEKLVSDLKGTLDYYECELADILRELPRKSIAIKEKSQLLSSILKQTTRKDDLIQKINNSIEELKRRQRDVSSTTSGLTKKLYNVQKDIQELRRFYSEIGVKMSKLHDDFEKIIL